MPDNGEVWRRLKTVPYPGYRCDIVSFGLVREVREVRVEDPAATIVLAIGHLDDATATAITDGVRSAATAAGVTSITLRITRPEQGRPRFARSPVGDVNDIPRGSIERILVVASGKGGAAKSTVAVNLAVALASQGLCTGLLDADAYGPNVPRMLVLGDRLPVIKGQIVPAERYGVWVAPVGLLLNADQPLIWRGPITHKLMRQLVVDVAWGPIDIMVVDLPPGTSAIPLSIGQHLQPDAAVVVATPQGVVIDDARRAVVMLRRLDVPIAGLIENMTGFVCDGCGREHNLFGRGGVERWAREIDIPFLAAVPFELAARTGGDEGRPIALDLASPAGRALRNAAETMHHHLVPTLGRAAS